jgi:hypothetical protein
MNPLLLAALINEVALPELTRWLTSLHSSNTPVTDAVVLQKLITDTNIGIQVGEAFLADYQARHATSNPNTVPTEVVPPTPLG